MRTREQEKRRFRRTINFGAVTLLVVGLLALAFELSREWLEFLVLASLLPTCFGLFKHFRWARKNQEVIWQHTIFSQYVFYTKRDNPFRYNFHLYGLLFGSVGIPLITIYCLFRIL